ncbi:alpha/beta hydrolase family protein [Candidatus Latescibacterota bacterium]
MKRREILKGSVAMSLGIMNDNNGMAAEDENPFPPMKIIKKEPERYSPLAYLEKVHDETVPALTFNAQTPNVAAQWQKALRTKLWELLGETHEPGAAAPSSSRIDSEDVNDYVREKWEIEVVPGRSMPFYILRPRSMSSDTKTVLCLHGHGNGAKDIMNMPLDVEAEELIRTLNTDYALQCVKRGWCAVVPELFTFGERLDFVEGARLGFDGGCEKPSLNAIHLGKTLIGIRAKDICTLIDWMDSRNEFNMEELACMGLSGGGMMTMYTSGLDTRIKRALIAGYVTEASGSILGIRHCSCTYVPNHAKWADFPDIAGLIAPRPLIVQSGKRDAIFPIESTRKAFEKIKKVYAVFNETDRLLLHEHKGFHEFWSPSLDSLFG